MPRSVTNPAKVATNAISCALERVDVGSHHMLSGDQRCILDDLVIYDPTTTPVVVKPQCLSISALATRVTPARKLSKQVSDCDNVDFNNYTKEVGPHSSRTGRTPLLIQKHRPKPRPHPSVQPHAQVSKISCRRYRYYE